MISPTLIRRSLTILLLLVLFPINFIIRPIQAQAAVDPARHSSSQPAPATHHIEGHYLFGVLNDEGEHYSDLWERGVRATIFELQWKRYEPQPGVYDQAYIAHLKEELRQIKSQGWYVQLVPGFHYAPDWVFTQFPNMYYVNQYGEIYNPDPVAEGDFRVINAPFNPQARSLVAGYLARIFQDFDQNDPELRFDAVRVGGGVQGELRYPPARWNGHTNSFWAFDIYAQDPNTSRIPAAVTGWHPGIDPNPGSVDRQQLLVNPGFEQESALLPLLGWAPDEEVNAKRRSSLVHNGSYALEVNISTPHRVHQFVRVAPNTTYTVNGWLRSDNSDAQARLFLLQYDTTQVPISGAPFTKLESERTAWHQVSGELTTGPGTYFLKVELDGDRPGAYYFDDLYLAPQGAPGAPSREINVPLDFYNWYTEKLSNYQNWQIAELRKYTNSELHLVYAGKGIMPRQLNDALTNDLAGDSWAEASSALYAATNYPQHLEALPQDDQLAIYLTGIEDPPAEMVNDFSPYPGTWSAARWLSQLARQHGMPIWAENTGGDSVAEMNLTADRLRLNSFSGLMWIKESELYSGNPDLAGIDDYSRIIFQHNTQQRIYLPEINLGTQP